MTRPHVNSKNSSTVLPIIHLERKRTLFRGIVIKPRMTAQTWLILENRLKELRELGASEQDIKQCREIYKKGIALYSYIR